MAVDREQVLTILREHAPELRRRGVSHAGLFGSLARGEAQSRSDIDILIELDPQAPVGAFEYVGITQYLSDRFAAPVDVANRSSLKALVRPSAERTRSMPSDRTVLALAVIQDHAGLLSPSWPT